MYNEIIFFEENIMIKPIFFPFQTQPLHASNFI